VNWQTIQDHWGQAGERVKAQWSLLTDADVHGVAGRRGRLVGLIQERYGVARTEAENQLAEWQRKATGAWFVDDEDRT
jgi:uncharacterized protein YjbJ (UPF0337 family)